MKLVPVESTSYMETLLYRLLKERTPEQSISHRTLPSMEEHRAFIKKHPYDAWYIIERNGAGIGSIYITSNSEIGIFLFKQYQGKEFGRAALAMLLKKHPRPRYLANVNPDNLNSRKFFESMGFEGPIQITYELKP